MRAILPVLGDTDDLCPTTQMVCDQATRLALRGVFYELATRECEFGNSATRSDAGGSHQRLRWYHTGPTQV